MGRKRKAETEKFHHKDRQLDFHYEGEGHDRTLVIEGGITAVSHVKTFPRHPINHFEGNVRIEGGITGDASAEHSTRVQFHAKRNTTSTIQGSVSARALVVAEDPREGMFYGAPGNPRELSRVVVEGNVAGVIDVFNMAVDIAGNVEKSGEIRAHVIHVGGDVSGSLVTLHKLTRAASLPVKERSSVVIEGSLRSGSTLGLVGDADLIIRGTAESGTYIYLPDKGTLHIGIIETGAKIIAAERDIVAGKMDEEALKYIKAKTVRSFETGLVYVPGAELLAKDGRKLAEITAAIMPDAPLPSASIDPTEGGTANTRGRRK